MALTNVFMTKLYNLPHLFYRFSGYLFIKVGKIAACSLGTTVLLIQVLVVLVLFECSSYMLRRSVTNFKACVPISAVVWVILTANV
jgi:hypothetical protein